MARPELGMFEEDPRSNAGADALALLDAQMQQSNPTTKDEISWASPKFLDYLDDDPKTVAARAAVVEARTWDAYRESGAWKMQAGKEYSPSEH